MKVASGISEGSCLAKRSGQWIWQIDPVSVISTRGLAQVAAVVHMKSKTSEMPGSPYMAIDTVSKSPRTIIKRVANYHSQVRQHRGEG